jgi:hypothetical protein
MNRGSSLAPAAALALLAAACGAPAAQREASSRALAEVETLDGGTRPSRHQLGDHTLWLAPGSRATVGRDGDALVVAVDRGRARLVAAASAAAFVATSDGDRLDARGRDLLLERGHDGRLRSAPTAARPELAAWSLSTDGAPPGAVGRLETRAAAGDDGALALRRLAITVRTEGDLAHTEVEHVFHNPADEVREGTFRFPLPDGALLLGLAMEIDGRLMEGSIVERDKARRVYEQIVDDMQDPALLEWEEGSWFKLRVFPIEARADKRVVLRYAAPLRRTLEGWELGHALATPAGAPPIGEVVLTVDGVTRVRRSQVSDGGELVVPIAAAAVPTVMQEETADALYTAVRVAPALDRLPARSPGARRVVVVVDTSRSALEGSALATELAAAALAELGPDDRFVLAAADLTTRFHAADYVPAGADQRAAALGFLATIEPDGASDLGAALAAAAARRPTAVVYVGDGTATWGQTTPAALRERAAAVGAPIHAALIGRGTSLALWRDLAGMTGGRAMAVRTELDARRFALAAGRADELRRIDGATVTAIDGAVIHPAAPTALYEGDELVWVIKTARGAAPAELRLTGTAGGTPFEQRVSLAPAARTRLVAQRWASHEIAARDAAGAPREELVALSTGHGVLSRHTSLLVLESEEAYREHQIARDQAAAGDTPRVSGGDLESLGARQASLSPDEIQPGDPEIKIPAPADARAVVVSLPTGETKLAEWDDELAAWMVRFLVDKDTADGEYWASIAITHGDGRVERLRLPYLVDTVAPAIEVDVVRRGDRFELTARAIGRGPRRAVERVEVLLPGGELLRLVPVARGRFAATWRPSVMPAGGTLRFVASDRALNQATVEIALPAR